MDLSNNFKNKKKKSKLILKSILKKLFNFFILNYLIRNLQKFSNSKHNNLKKLKTQTQT